MFNADIYVDLLLLFSLCSSPLLSNMAAQGGYMSDPSAILEKNLAIFPSQFKPDD